MRTTDETIAWYRTHENKDQLGFQPNGQCMKIVRTARGLSAMFPSALASQVATPEKYQIEDPADIRQGMVGYFDDPNDDNPFGHVVTWVGRVSGESRKSLSSLLCRTNSVVDGRIVVVRGDYFEKHWGDAFQFASTWLNGEPIPDFDERKTKKKPLNGAASLNKALEIIDRSIKHHEKAGHDRLVAALKRDRDQLKKTIKQFSQKKEKKA